MHLTSYVLDETHGYDGYGREVESYLLGMYQETDGSIILRRHSPIKIRYF